MSKLGKRLIQAAREGVAIARGELDPSTYRVHHDDDANGLDQGGASFIGAMIGAFLVIWALIDEAASRQLG